MKRRVLSLLLTAVMLMAMVPAVFAASPTSGKCGDNLTWRLVDDTLYIEGTGDMYNYLPGEKGDVGIAPWKDADAFYNHEWTWGGGFKVKIAPGVTSVGDYAFDNLYVRDISLPEGITKIGKYAFCECFYIEKISLPESLDSIGAYAFESCFNMTTIDFPSKMTDIGERAFSVCQALKSVRIPEGITTIEEYTFYDCGQLTSVSLPTTLKSIEYGAFSYCTHLTEVEIPQSVVSIVGDAFSYCQRLESIVIPEGVADLEGAFYDCRSLKEVTIPASVTSISRFAFQDCRSLTDVYYGGSERQWQELKDNSWNWSKELDEATIHYSAPGTAEPETPAFTDVPADAWYADAVNWAVEKEITNGMTSTTFEPGTTCTQAHIITFIWRAYGKLEPKSAVSPFTDVTDPGAWYYKAALWAAETGVANPGTTFDPSAPCTRAQAVTYLWRAANKPAVSGGNTFTDVPANSECAAAVAWAVGKKITNGMTSTTFEPDTICTRGHIVTFLYRDLEL